jgi:parvulin-like peptidyl-prolyl isomerase
LSSPVGLLTGLALALAVAGCGGGSESVPAGAVAVVDGTEIPKAELDAQIDTARKSYSSQQREFPKAGTPEYKTLRDGFVQFLVQREQLEQKADELELEVTEEQVAGRLEQVKQQYFGGDEQRFREQLVDQGLTEPRVREDLRAQLLSERIFNAVTKDVKVSDADVEAYYEKNAEQFSTPESREVRHILVKTRAQAEAIAAELKGGGDFAALAKKHSTDTGSKASGGKLTITRGQTVAPFDKQAFALAKNEVSAPVKTEFGFHLIEPLSEVKEASKAPLKEVRDSIRQQLLQTKKNEAMTEWVDELKKEYDDKVSYATGFTPPPAATGTTSTSSVAEDE